MSINHFMNKIKGQMDIDSTTIICLLVIIFVGLGSFGLGRLSVSNKDENIEIGSSNTNFADVKDEIGKSGEVSINIIDDNSFKEKMYVASKNGKLYYSTSCSGAKRISEKNAVWFASREDAEKAGYTLSSSCK